MITNCPPMARTKSCSVLMYMPVLRSIFGTQLRHGSLIHAASFGGPSEVLTSLLNHAILIV